jgi:type IV secretion system protein VirB4
MAATAAPYGARLAAGPAQAAASEPARATRDTGFSRWASKLFGRQPTARAPRFWAEAAQENPLSSFVSAAGPVNEHDIVTRGGDYFRVYALQGVGFEGEDPARIEEHHRALSALVKNLLPGRSAVYLHRIRRRADNGLARTHGVADSFAHSSHPQETGDPETTFAQGFATRYEQNLSRHPLHVTELYLTLLVRPAQRVRDLPKQASRTKAGFPAASSGETTAPHSARDTLRLQTLQELQELGSLAERSLREFGLRLLGVREQSASAPSAASNHPLAPPSALQWEAGQLLCELINGITPGPRRRVPVPQGPAWQSLPDARLNFAGDTLEIRSLHSRRYAKLLGLKRLQRHVEPGTLGALLYEPCEFIETQCWASVPKRQAQAALVLQRDQLLASEDAGRTEIEELDGALDLLAAGELAMGEYAYTLAVFGESVDEAARHAARCAAALIETTDLELASIDLVADAAWFSQQPGNLQWRPRKATISNRAFAALACAHNVRSGKPTGNPWGPAIAQLRGCSGTPYHFSFHASPPGVDCTGQRLPGNTLVIGATGSGKTTLLGTLLTLSATLPTPPRLVSFSLDRDTEILIRALGGRFYRLRFGVPTGLNPFALFGAEDAAEAQGFLTRLITRCIHHPSHAQHGHHAHHPGQSGAHAAVQPVQLSLLPSDEEAISRAVEATMLLEPALRSFSTVRQNLPRNGPNSLYDRLGRWCQGAELGWVFDTPERSTPERDRSERDHLARIHSALPAGHPTPHTIGFDYTELLDHPDIRTPVLMVLLQQMQLMLNGEPLIYHVAEAWKALGDPVFAPFLKQQQKTIRKKNGLGVFDTQQVEDLLATDNGRVMVEQSPTKLLLANPDATRSDYVDGLGLTESEFDLFRQVAVRSQRRFVVKQGEDFVPCELDLSGMPDDLAILSATPDNLRRLDKARADAQSRFGPQAAEDPAHWLPLYLELVRGGGGGGGGAGASRV